MWGPGSSGDGLQGFAGLALLFVPMFLIMYLLIVRPQKLEQKKHQQMVANLKKGDRVVTSGGVHGMVANVKEKTVMLKVAENTRLEVSRSAITQVVKQSSDEEK